MSNSEIHVCIVDSLKRRNNARSNLSLGLAEGFTKLGIGFTRIQDSSELCVNPQNIPERSNLVIVPYWIGPKAFDMNLAAIKAARPQAKLALYTGTSPFWDGCPWINYRSGTRTLQTVGLDATQKANFEAIDVFFVVHARGSVKPACQCEVGMGLFPELVPGAKAPGPLIVLDFMKSGWDEKQYEQSAHVLAGICERMQDVHVAVLGTNKIAPTILPPHQVFTVPQEFNPWQQMIGLWQSAWAFVAMNESFGYPLIENRACGTNVYSDPTCEIPTFHKTIDISLLEIDIEHMKSAGPNGRADLATKTSDDLRNFLPAFVSWKDTCQRMLEAIA